jgi:hypothetical protein|tara:strand:- start:15 stop:125 length:111 start_codon:yes stop_codon:yes gene_type:complete
MKNKVCNDKCPFEKLSKIAANALKPSVKPLKIASKI